MNYNEMKVARRGVEFKLKSVKEAIDKLYIGVGNDASLIIADLYELRDKYDLQLCGLDEAMGRMEMDAQDQHEEFQRSQGAWE